MLIEENNSTAEKTPTNFEVLPEIWFKESKPFSILSLDKIDEEEEEKEEEKIFYRDPILLEG